MSALRPIQQTVKAARRRLLWQTILDRLGIAIAVGLSLGLAWQLAEPWLIADAPAWLGWTVLGSVTALIVVATLVYTIWKRPSQQRAALELDSRFGLRERITTALSLDERTRESSAGHAVLADASSKLESLSLGSQFPLRPRRSAIFIPILALAIGLVAFLYEPNTGMADDAKVADEEKKQDQQQVASAAKTVRPFTKQTKPLGEKERGNKSEELKELEKELNAMMKKYDLDPNRETPEKLREKIADITSMEEKLKKFNDEEFKKLDQMDQRMKQLDDLKNDPDFQDGPAKNLNDALSKGDLKKAEDELDMLRKKVKNKELSPEDREKLAKQMEKMQEQLQQLTRDKERKEKLEKMIDEAKKEGRDAESLERELEALNEQSQQGSETAEKLAEQLRQASQSMSADELEDVAEELSQAGMTMQDIESDLQDLQDSSEHLQRLKEERKAACSACQGEVESDKPGHKDWAKGRGQGSGLREENKDAKSNSVSERVRGLFDPKGKKTYGGSTTGPAFNKATTSELGPIIQEAAQTAPQAVDTQRLSREDKDTVREYFKNLGEQK